MGCCGLYTEDGATLLVGTWEKRSLIPWRLRVPIWKVNVCSWFLRLSVVPWCRVKTNDDFTCTSANVMYYITYALCEKLSAKLRKMTKKHPNQSFDILIFLTTPNNTWRSATFPYTKGRKGWIASGSWRAACLRTKYLKHNVIRNRRHSSTNEETWSHWLCFKYVFYAVWPRGHNRQ